MNSNNSNLFLHLIVTPALSTEMELHIELNSGYLTVQNKSHHFLKCWDNCIDATHVWFLSGDSTVTILDTCFTTVILP